jgi:hypothetical protein
MATKFVTNLDLVQNQIVNGRFESLASDPNTGNFVGRVVYNTTENVIKWYDGTGWRKVVHAVASAGGNSAALSVSESSGSVSITPNAATSTDPGVMSAADKTKLDAATSSNTGSTIVFRDASGDFAANDITANKVTGLVAPTADTDAANKAYVDAARSGLDVKQSVRVATTGSDISLSNTTTSIDGVTLSDGDRVLVKDQSTGSENGIYVVSTSGAWSRSTDADSSAEVTAGLFTFVAEGAANGDSGWVLSTNDTITLDTTALTFAKFSGAGQIVAGDGLSKSGTQSNQIDVNVDGTTTYIDGSDNVAVKSSATQYEVLISDGAGTTPTWGALDLSQGAAVTNDLPVTHGGTGASTAADARNNLADTTSGTTSTPTLARVAAQDCAASSGSTSITTVTHNFGTKDILVQVFEVSTGATVIADSVRTSTSAATVTINGASITSGDYRIVVTG